MTGRYPALPRLRNHPAFHLSHIPSRKLLSCMLSTYTQSEWGESRLYNDVCIQSSNHGVLDQPLVLDIVQTTAVNKRTLPNSQTLLSRGK